MWRIVLCFMIFVAFVQGRGEITILHHPTSLSFKGHERLDESDVTEVFSATMGFSISLGSSWPGLFLKDPFHSVEAVVAIAADGVSDLGGGNGHHFPLRTNTDDKQIFNVMKERILEHNPTGGSLIVDTDLADGMDIIKEYEFFHGIKHIKKSKAMYNFLKHSVDVDRQFIQELNLINAIADEVERGAIKKDLQPDYYRIKCSGLHAVSDFHGENSTATKEAKQLFLAAIIGLNEAFNKAYDGNVLVAIISSDASHTRRARSVTDPKAAKATEDDNINLAKAYSSNYPVVFNIILWFGVALVFSLLAVALVIGNMDPGRDSIIYRMTSTRMKKDN